MGKIYVIKGVSIYLYYREHNPPHIHAFYAEFEVLIRISNGEILWGYLPKSQIRLVKQWLSDPEVKRKLTIMFHEMNPHLRP
ncbi:MAG: DUF4160 domain-containing protein [Bacteroidota bacterium]